MGCLKLAYQEQKTPLKVVSGGLGQGEKNVQRFYSQDPAGQFASPYMAMANNWPVLSDPDGRIVWFVPVIIGAAVGAYAGASIESNNWNFTQWDNNWWKGAITGAIIGATAGSFVSAAIGASGMTTAAGAATKGWGLTTSMLNSGSINIGMSAISGQGFDGMWKAGLVGLASGGWTATGGLGLAKTGLAGKLGYQAIGSAGRSIGGNWSAGKGLLSKVTVGVGPVNLTFGKGQQLFQAQNNIGNIIMNGYGLLNIGFGGSISWDKENLTPIYRGGIADLFFPEGESGFSPHVVTGNSELSKGGILGHELHHLWQSRSLGDLFIPNYILQGGLSMLISGGMYDRNSYPSFVSDLTNYYETIAEHYTWW